MSLVWLALRLSWREITGVTELISPSIRFSSQEIAGETGVLTRFEFTSNGRSVSTLSLYCVTLTDGASREVAADLAD